MPEEERHAERHEQKAAGDDLSDAAMNRLRERMAEQADIDRHSDEQAAEAGLPGEGDRRDRAGLPGAGMMGESRS